MNSSLIAIFMRPDATLELDSLESLVSGAGFVLRSPKSGNITTIDDEGEFHFVERDTLALRVSQRRDTRLQFWESTWTDRFPGDLYCRLRFTREATRVEFGELPRDPTSLLVEIWSFAQKTLDDGRTLGLVVDRRGLAEEHGDWDALVVHGKSYEGPCPELLCILKDQEGLLPPTCARFHRHELRHHIVVCDDKMNTLVKKV